jgi:hypothetical protein
VNKLKRTILFIIFSLCFFSLAFAEEKTEEKNSGSDPAEKQLPAESTGLEISGFFNVLATNYHNNPNMLSLGDFELDLENSYKQHIFMAAALVFHEDGAEFAAGFIDYHLFGGKISPRGPLFEEEGIHFQVGKFDVPIGNDYEYFAATDRESILPPLTTELLMDGGYSDVGLRFLLNFISFHSSLFLLRGEGDGNAYGGRIGISPFHNPYILKKKERSALEMGFSLIYDMNKDWQREQFIWAGDIEGKISFLTIRSEYYHRQGEIPLEFEDAIEKSVGTVSPSVENIPTAIARDAAVVSDEPGDTNRTLSGFHLTGKFDLPEIHPSFAVALYSRYDHFKAKFADTPEDSSSRATLGLNLNIYELLTWKIEYLRFIKTFQQTPLAGIYGKNSIYGELVVSF